MHRIFCFVRNGAGVCSRGTLADAMDYAERIRGWDKHSGRDAHRDEFGGVHATTYRVEEHVWDGEKDGYREVARYTVDGYRPPFPGMNEPLVVG